MTLTNAFWGERGTRVVAWLTAPELRSAVADALAHAEAEAAREALAAVGRFLGAHVR